MIADNEAGLLFKNKRDRKIINVDPKGRPGDNSTRFDIDTVGWCRLTVSNPVLKAPMVTATSA